LYYDGCYWEIHIDLISSVEKSLLLSNTDWQQMLQLPGAKRELLITWRINRYARAPLPGDFNWAFVSGYLHQPGNTLAAFLEVNRESILDLYVYIVPDEEGAQQYLVTVTLLVCQECSDELFAECESQLSEHLSILQGSGGPLIFMQIAQEAVPDNLFHMMDFVARPEDFTMRDMYVMKRLSVDYLCFPE